MSLEELQRALLDPSAPIPSGWPSGAWGTLLLFIVPLGAGIPTGVLFGRDAGVSPFAMPVLYFVSDLVLAAYFEPILLWLRRLGRTRPAVARAAQAFRTVLANLGLQEGSRGRFRLVLVSFSVDPMTGRAATVVAGHGFVSGWALAIAGDMLYFAVLMVSTLWLEQALGNERWTIGIMVLVSLFLPNLIRRVVGRGTRRAA